MELESIVRNGKTPQKLARRARIILLSATGVSTGQIVPQLDTSIPTITRWRTRYQTDGITGLLNDRSRPGRKKQIEDSKVREVVERRSWLEFGECPTNLESTWIEASFSPLFQAEP
jgi:transposase